MIDFIQQHGVWAALTVAVGWIARERLNILACGAWLVKSGGLIGLGRKLLFGSPARGDARPTLPKSALPTPNSENP